MFFSVEFRPINWSLAALFRLPRWIAGKVRQRRQATSQRRRSILHILAKPNATGPDKSHDSEGMTVGSMGGRGPSVSAWLGIWHASSFYHIGDNAIRRDRRGVETTHGLFWPVFFEGKGAFRMYKRRTRFQVLHAVFSLFTLTIITPASLAPSLSLQPRFFRLVPEVLGHSLLVFQSLALSSCVVRPLSPLWARSLMARSFPTPPASQARALPSSLRRWLW